jgi:hypothetical protein
VNDAELLTATFPAQKWAVEGLIPEGVTIFAGKAKSGKSWAALNLALSVVDGSPAFGRFSVNRGEVLYLALEDSWTRMQARLKGLLRGRDEVPTGLLHIETEWPMAEEGGMAEIENWLQDFPHARLVVIDVMRRFQGIGYSYSKDSAKIQALGALGMKYHVGIIAVFHLYKGPGVSATSPDWLDKVQGSVGVTGAAQAIIGLYRDRGGVEGLLRVTGKDVPEQDVPLVYDSGHGTWTASLEGGTVAPALSDERAQVLAAIEVHPGSTAPETATLMGTSYPALRHLMWAMNQSGQLVNIDGRYFTEAQAEAATAPDANPQLSFTEVPAVTLTAEVKGNVLTLSRNGHR